jgi:hypothetical protein
MKNLNIWCRCGPLTLQTAADILKVNNAYLIITTIIIIIIIIILR